MTYFSLRKPQVTPDEPEDQPEPEPDEPMIDNETPGEPDEEAPAVPRPAARVVWDGCTGPSRWLTHRLGPGPSFGVHAVGVWACGFYGPLAATGIIGSWTLAALAFIPREDLHRAAATIERLDARRHAPETLDEEPAGEPDETPPADPRTAILRLLYNLLGDRPAIHLNTVLAHLQDHGQWEGKSVADLRQHLEAHGIPTQPKVKVAGVPTRGVVRADLDALSPDGHTAPSPAPSPHV